MIHRVRLLIQQVRADMLAEAERRRPGQAKVLQKQLAKRIGIDNALMTKIEAGKRAGLHSDTLKEVVDHLGLDPSFFFDDEIGEEPHYRDHLRKNRPRAGEDAKPPAHWEAFSEQWHRFDELTPDEQNQLRNMVFPGHEPRDWTDWIRPAEWILELRRP